MSAFNCSKLKKNGKMPVTVASLIPDMKKFEKLHNDYKRHDFIPEFRFDLSDMDGNGMEKYLKLVERNNIMGIFTFRSSDSAEAEDAYMPSVFHGNLIFDIEIESYRNFRNDIQKDRLILSSHFRNSAVTMRRFSEILSMECGAIKIATFSDTIESIHLMNNMYLAKDQRPLSFVPMGPDREARLISGLSVSDFIYTAYEEPLAQGQINYTDIEKIFSKLICNDHHRFYQRL